MTAPPPTPRAPIWQLLGGLTISAVLLYYSLRGIQFSQVLEYVRGSHLAPMLLAVGLATLTFPLRIFRWQLLLHGDDGRTLGTAPLWHAIAMGFMANNVLPLRMGEVVRTIAASKLTRTRLTSVAASVAVERLFDAITVVTLLAVGLLSAQLPPSDVSDQVARSVTFSVTIFGGLALLGLGGAGLVVAYPVVAEQLVHKVIPSEKIATKLVVIIEGVRHGFSALRSPGRVVGVALWSFVIWGVSALSFYMMFVAFGIHADYAVALLMQGLIMFAIALPSSPGYVGVFEAPIVGVLGLYLVDKNLAAAYALTYHVTTFLPITLLGAWSIFRTNLGLGSLRRAES